VKKRAEQDESFNIIGSRLLELASRAQEILEEIFENPEVNEKRALVKFLVHNCRLNDRKLELELNSHLM